MNEEEDYEGEAGEIVWLNVGGKRFATTKTTIERSGADSFLTTILNYSRNKQMKVPKDQSGAIFIDRNPETFSVVLEYLRTGQVILPGFLTKEQALAEFAFYNIPIEKELSTTQPSVDDVCNGRVTFATPKALDSYWRNQGNKFVQQHLKKLRNAVVLSIMFSKPHDQIQFCSFCPPARSGENSVTPRNQIQCENASDWPSLGESAISFTTPLSVLSTAMFRLFLRAVSSSLTLEVGFQVSYEHLFIPPTGVMGVGGVATTCASLAVDLSLECGSQAAETTAIRQLLERNRTGDCFKTTETTPREMNNAARIMRGFGWREGKGLGKHENGRSQHIRVNLKKDRLGIGCGTSHNPIIGENNSTTPWWERVYNQAAAADIAASASSSKKQQETAKPKEEKAKPQQQKVVICGAPMFVQGHTLRSKDEASDSSEISSNSSSSDGGGSEDEKVVSPIEDDEGGSVSVSKGTFVACEGRTGKRAAQTAKLSRLRLQEEHWLQQRSKRIHLE